MGNFTRDTIITFVTRVLQLIVGWGVVIIIARVLGPEKNGIYALSVLLPVFLITITGFGFTPALVFYIGKRKYSLKEIFGTNIILSVLVSILAITIGLVIVFFFSNRIFPGVPKEYLYLVLSLVPFKNFITIIENILLGLRKIKKYNLISLLQTILFLIFVGVLLLGLHFGIKAAILSEVMSLFAGCIILFWQVKKETGGLSLFLNKNLSLDIFSYGMKAYFGHIANFLYLRINVWMINIFLNPLSVGFFSVAAVLAEKIQLISQSASVVLFPKVASETEERRLKEFTPLTCRNVLFITFLAVLVVFALSHWIIILFYSEAYLNSILPFQILLIGTIFMSGYTVMTYDLAGRGKPMINTNIAIGALILNVILNLILIPKFGIVGAAWATTVSYVVAFIIKLFVYIKISGNEIKNIIFVKKSDFKLYRQIFFSLMERK